MNFFARLNRTPWERLLTATSILLLSLPFSANAELPNDIIGRLFLSPAERAKIEQTRGQDIATDVTFEDTAPKAAVKPKGAAVALNGLVRRADGNDVIWVNGQMIGDRLGTSAEVKVRRGPDANNNVVLESTGIARPVKLKPGQSWDKLTNKAVDCYRCADPDNSSVPAAANKSDDKE